MRSAARFGVASHCPGSPRAAGIRRAGESGLGALDIVPRIAVVNISRALEELGRLGFWRIALTAHGDAPLKEAATQGDIAVVLGAEGSGLRRLVRESCDVSAFIPLGTAMESLNVSNAAAIAFYELTRIS